MTETLPTRERGPDNPSRWSGTYTFTAILNCIKIDVSLVHGNVLMAWLSHRESLLLAEPQVVCFGSTPKQCLEFVKGHVFGRERVWLLEYFTRLDPDASHAYRIHCMMERGKRDLALEAENEARLKSSEYQRMMMQRLILDMSKPD